MSSVQRVVSLMETMLETDGDISIRELAQRTGVPKSTVQRLLNSLETSGWVDQDEKTQNYHIALRFLSFADAWRLKLELTRQARRVMNEQCAQTHQTILLLVQEGVQGICLHKVEPERTIKLVAEVGKAFPLYAAACGKILLAFAPPSFQEEILSSPLKSYTPKTITDPSALREEIRKIRREGCAISFEEMTLGAAEIAVPLLNAQGDLVAALSIAGLHFDMEGRFTEFEELLREGARRILGQDDSEGSQGHVVG